MVSVTFSNTEIQSLVKLLDSAVKANGLRAVKETAVLINKLEKAVEEAQPKEEELDKDN